MIKGEMIYEGKAKSVFATDDPAVVLVYFKDDATAGNGAKHDIIEGKGIINNRISEFFFKQLKDRGIKTHFVEKIGEREMVVKKLDMIKLEVVVRNIVAGSLVKRLGLAEGTPLAVPVVEYYYKSDLAKIDELNQMEHIAFSVNTILRDLLKAKNVDLIDFKLEFGRGEYGEVILADEISPDNCRFWDTVTHEKLDKDRFRQDLGGVEEAYKEMLDRLTM